MWPMTYDMALLLAFDRHQELLTLAEKLQRHDDLATRRPGWQRLLGRLLVGVGSALTAWGASLRRDAVEYQEAASVPTTGLAR